MELILALLLTCGENIKCDNQAQQCKFAAEYVVNQNSDCSGEIKGDLADACDMVQSAKCKVKP